jgi:hypothetical protein
VPFHLAARLPEKWKARRGGMKKSNNDDKAERIRQLDDEIYEINQFLLDYIHTWNPSTGSLIINSGRARVDENNQVRLGNWPLRREPQTGTPYRDFADIYSRLERSEAMRAERKALLEGKTARLDKLEKIQWGARPVDFAEIFGKLFDSCFFKVDGKKTGKNTRTREKFFILLAEHFVQSDGKPFKSHSLVNLYKKKTSAHRIIISKPNC